MLNCRCATFQENEKIKYVHEWKSLVMERCFVLLRQKRLRAKLVLDLLTRWDFQLQPHYFYSLLEKLESMDPVKEQLTTIIYTLM